MRIFWAFIVMLLLVAGLVYGLDQIKPGSNAVAAASRRTTDPSPTPQDPAAAGHNTASPAPVENQPASSGPSEPDRGDKDLNPAALDDTASKLTDDSAATDQAQSVDDAAASTGSDLDTAASAQTGDEDTAADEQVNETQTTDAETAVNPLVAALTSSGAGTRTNPYKVTWDLLLSAQQTYNPREERTEIPTEIQKLDDKWVQITGYLMVPLGLEEAEEMYVMLNMWDGCCVGVPPTPYDAIEVRLAETIPAEEARYMTYGTMTGKFDVDPYVLNGWLMGMYLMDDATVEADM